MEEKQSNITDIAINESKSSTSLQSMTAIRNLQLDVVGNNESTIKVLGQLAASGVIPAKSANEALVYYEKCKELDIPFVNSMSRMFLIKGKVGADVHLLKSLCFRSRCVHWVKTKDFVLTQTYTDGSNTFDFEVGVPLPNNFKLIPTEVLTGEEAGSMRKTILMEGKIPLIKLPKSTPYRCTEYKFEREYVSSVTGVIHIITAVSKFTTMDKLTAGLGLDKDGGAARERPWVKYESSMFDKSAWTPGARAVADDILQGMYALNELYDINKMKYDLVDGEAVLIQ